MIVSFHEGYLLIVIACALFCLLSLIYSVINRFTESGREERLEKRAKLMADMLYLYPEKEQQEQQDITKKIYKMLWRNSGVLALLKAMDQLHWTSADKIPPMSRQTLCEILLERYSRTYKNSDPMVQGVMIELCIRADVSSSMLKAHLLKQLDAHDMVLRTECFRCIASQQDRQLMLKALTKVSGKNISFTSKMLTDILMEYEGDIEKLMNTLFPKINQFSLEIQVAVIQVLTNLRLSDYAESVLHFLKDPDNEKESRLAAIKYFEAVHYEPCVSVLLEYLKNDSWEFEAVAARVLNSYDCSFAFPVLMESLTSQNWYVRNSCAGIIVNHCTADQIQQALHSEDHYAADSIRYALSQNDKLTGKGEA